MINYKYCPQCTNLLKKINNRFICSKCNIKIYLNSSPCVQALPIRSNKLLMIRRKINPHKGSLDVIGGFLEFGEDPKKGAMREVKEEAGITIKIDKLLGVYSDRYGNNGKHIIVIYYLCKILKGNPRPMDDVASLNWIKIDNIPFDEIKFPNVKKALKDLQIYFKSQKSQKLQFNSSVC